MHTSTVSGQLNLRNGQGSQDPWPYVFLGHRTSQSVVASARAKRPKAKAQDRSRSLLGGFRVFEPIVPFNVLATPVEGKKIGDQE